MTGEPVILVDQQFSKTAYRERLQKSVLRSKSSIEYKFQNISAVLHDHRVPFIDGYKPARNYQAALATEVIRQIEAHPKLLDIMRIAVLKPAVPRLDIQWHAQVPTRPLLEIVGPSSRRAFHTDFAQLEQSNSDLGKAGELAVLARERSRLESAGRADLAERVRHSAVERGDGLGYDIESFRTDGSRTFLEVKTTRRGVDWPMLVTRNEVEVSRELGGSYHLVRVFSFDKPTVGLYAVPGAIDVTCDLSPESWQALPKPGMATPMVA